MTVPAGATRAHGTVTGDDPRWSRVARAVADGTGILAGQRVMIALTDVAAMPATQAIVAACLARGAHPQVQLVDERFDRAALQIADKDQLAWVPEIEAYGMDWADVYVAVRGLVPPQPEIADVDPAKTAALRAAKGKISTLRWQRTEWTILRVPTPDWADYAGVPYETLVDELVAGCTRDWDTDRASWNRLARRLNGAQEVVITGPQTRLSFSLEGRRWIVFAGERNLPDGEMATAPLVDTVSGILHIEDPFVFAGQQVAGLTLTWDQGRLVDVVADEGQELARALVKTDVGSSRIGEFGVGLNPSLRRMTGDLFFDEKIEGTVHVALGRAYPDCGGTNQSALHWDIVKDLRARAGRPGGEVTIDGVPLIAAGEVCWDHEGAWPADSA